jgi:release factor glutamine methyltransferase
MTLREAIRAAAARLDRVSDTPRLDAELLAAHCIGESRETLLLRHLDDPAPASLSEFMDRRAAGEPIAYIVGCRDFWTISLHVEPGVLIPRPDSETLLEAAVTHFGTKEPATILDLGTGSGALLLAALAQWPLAKGVGVDASPKAAAVAQDNANRLGMADRARIVVGDWASDIDQAFDLILCNPPYVAAHEILPVDVADHEPASALYAGSDGLDCYRRLIPEIARLLDPAGLALFEIGSSQGDAVSALFREAGFHPRIIKDLGDRDRCIAVNGSTIPMS